MKGVQITTITLSLSTNKAALFPATDLPVSSSCPPRLSSHFVSAVRYTLHFSASYAPCSADDIVVFGEQFDPELVPVLCVPRSGFGSLDVRTVTVVSYTMFCSCTTSVIVAITACTRRTATCIWLVFIIDDQITITLEIGL